MIQDWSLDIGGRGREKVLRDDKGICNPPSTQKDKKVEESKLFKSNSILPIHNIITYRKHRNMRDIKRTSYMGAFSNKEANIIHQGTWSKKY